MIGMCTTDFCVGLLVVGGVAEVVSPVAVVLGW